MEQSAILLSKYQGCLFGLAIGDALGAPVEFMSLNEIKMRYGKTGVTDFQPWDSFNAGFYTDDTQMALATAIGCIRACHRWKNRGICNSMAVIHSRYLEWLKSQNNRFHRRRAGNTCITASQSGKMGTIDEKINDSKGSGGIMRVAPIGLVVSLDTAFVKGAECAAITHGHPSGYLSAGFLAQLIAYLINDMNLIDAIELSVEELRKYDGHQETMDKVKLAMELSKSDIHVEKGITKIGEGFTGEEALGISLYCALKFSNNYKNGVLAAVNHSGDSDTTGAITGAILGTMLGIESIPSRWAKNVEGAEKIKKIANDMFKYIVKNQDIRYRSAEYYEYPPY